MKIIADLHMHSRFSRATSTALNIENLEKWARIKGIGLLGTGDFTHPKWILELKENLREDETGILKTKSGFNFMLTSEISLMYSQGGKGRRVHIVVLAPDFDIVKQITDYLLTKGRIDYDGRPIFKIPCPEFTEKLKSISKDVEIIPAHAWTPYFGVFGSMTGFDSLKDCFLDQEKNIHAIETGMSSDPAMNWRLSSLDKVQIVSFSDAHSFWPWRIGREATVFETEMNYKKIISAIQTGEKLTGTIETDPAYGKYHWDGHMDCKFSCAPEETRKLKNTCPVCKRPLTIGVKYRVEELADRPAGFQPKNRPGFYKLLPLSELISGSMGVPVASKKVFEIFNKLIGKFGSEYAIDLDADEKSLKEIVNDRLAKLILENREGKIKVKPGFDGQYGVAIIGGKEVGPEEPAAAKPAKPKPAKHKNNQKSLSEF